MLDKENNVLTFSSWENASDQVAICFIVVSDWLGVQWKFFTTIADWSAAKKVLSCCSNSGLLLRLNC